MGKKRNNAAKKKQGAKKKKISATYGVSVMKGGTIARNNGIIETGNPMDAKSSVNKQYTKADASKLPQTNGPVKSKQARVSLNEQDEFARQQASLEERSLMQQAQKKHQRKTKKQKQGWNTFAGPASMAPPTLNLIKTTQQLVDDAANQITQMSDFGQRLVPAAEGQSSLAAAAGVNWNASVMAKKMQEKSDMKRAQLNSFAALNDDSDSDNEWADSKPAAPQFQFQPASFSFQSSFVPVVGPGEDDIDPDL